MWEAVPRGRQYARSPRPDEFSYKALIRGCCLLDETQKSLGGIFFFWGGVIDAGYWQVLNLSSIGHALQQSRMLR